MTEPKPSFDESLNIFLQESVEKAQKDIEIFAFTARIEAQIADYMDINNLFCLSHSNGSLQASNISDYEALVYEELLREHTGNLPDDWSYSDLVEYALHMSQKASTDRIATEHHIKTSLMMTICANETFITVDPKIADANKKRFLAYLIVEAGVPIDDSWYVMCDTLIPGQGLTDDDTSYIDEAKAILEANLGNERIRSFIKNVRMIAIDNGEDIDNIHLVAMQCHWKFMVGSKSSEAQNARWQSTLHEQARNRSLKPETTQALEELFTETFPTLER